MAFARVTEWGPHIRFDTPVPLVPRAQVQVGDTVHSSHSGPRRVVKIERLGTEGQTTYLWLEWAHGPEAYPSDSTIPVLSFVEREV